MAASSQDQNSGVPASQQPRARKRGFWMILLINFVIFCIVAVLLLAALIYFKIIPSQWSTSFLGALSLAFGGIVSFVKTTLADKDFQQALRKRLTQWVSGDGEKESKDEKTAKDGSATSQPSITINFNPTITNTNTNTNSPVPLSTDKSAMVAQPTPVQQHQSTVVGMIASSSHIESHFLVGAPLTDPREFYGRHGDRIALFDRTRKGYSTSIVGPRRIGKTWLVSFLQLSLTAEPDAHFRIGYIDATRPGCASRAGFTAYALEALGSPVPAVMQAHLDLTAFEETIKDVRARGQIPVLCIDEFEHFGDHAIFDLHFFSELRSLAGPGLGLCMVIASKTPLIDIVGDIGKTSGFFNIFEQLTLKPFNSEEAEEFIVSKGPQAGLSDQECGYLRTYGREYSAKGPQWPPLRLQIAGAMLERDKMLAAAGHPGQYRPADMDYWKDFEERLEEKYRGMVKL